MTSDEEQEKRLQEKGLDAPRVTLKALQAKIIDTEIVKHISFTGQVLRWAVITVENGFAIVGDPSVAISAENDDQEEGEKIAIENSMNKIWGYEGYLLKQKLHEFQLGLSTDIGM